MSGYASYLHHGTEPTMKLPKIRKNALLQMFDDAPSPGKHGRPTSMTGAWKTLAEACGGVVILAARLGRDRDTLRRWAAGMTEPSEEVQTRVGELAAEMRCGMPPFGKEAADALAKALKKTGAK